MSLCSSLSLFCTVKLLHVQWPWCILVFKLKGSRLTNCMCQTRRKQIKQALQKVIVVAHSPSYRLCTKLFCYSYITILNLLHHQCASGLCVRTLDPNKIKVVNKCFHSLMYHQYWAQTFGTLSEYIVHSAFQMLTDLRLALYKFWNL